MRRRLGSSSEVARSADESRAEVMQPDAVYEHARRQWILFAGDGLGKPEPSAPLGERFSIFARKDFQELFWDFLAFVDRTSSFEHARVLLDRAILENDGVRRCAGRLQNPLIHLRGKLADLDARRLIEIPFHIHDCSGWYRGG